MPLEQAFFNDYIGVKFVLVVILAVGKRQKVGPAFILDQVFVVLTFRVWVNIAGVEFYPEGLGVVRVKVAIQLDKL